MTTEHRASRPPELLAPAGDRECIRAAIENGADAVYFGLDHGWNARVRATNIGLGELPEVMSSLRKRGVKGYVTLNTLVFADELPGIEETVRAVALAGVDAVLVQDLGLLRMLRRLCPELPIHASTQMTLTCAEAIQEAEKLGVERVVLARELSLDDIRRIRSQTTMPLEVFVHGALCVAYSGQCLTSESFGGRSANRGHCAQACRLPYDLVCDGRDVDLGDQKYLLSPQDLAAYALIPELVAAGVCSFKIEGRLKTPEYVANITRHYRRAVDEAWAGRVAQFTADDIREMELSFSRGFSPGWLPGNDHKRLVPGKSSAKRGVLAGTVVQVRRGRVVVRATSPLAAGDGVVFEGDRANDAEQGGRVFELWRHGQPIKQVGDGDLVELGFQHGAIDFSQLRDGQRMWKTDDPQLSARLRRTFTGADPVRKTTLRLRVSAEVGQPLSIAGEAESGARCQVCSSQPLEAARKHPLTLESVREQLGRLGGSVYELGEVTFESRGEPMVPHSVLGQLRREMLRQLDASVAEAAPRSLAPNTLDAMRADATSPAASGGTESDQMPQPKLWVLCRNLSQLDSALDAGVKLLYVDFADIREYREAVARTREREAELFLATTRIQKPDERGLLLAMQKHQATGFLARNLAGMEFCRRAGIPWVADFSFNVTNDLTAKWLLDQGAQRVTASYDMNRDQLQDLISTPGARDLEVVIHQHMPMFHMEHCVFCAVLSPGTDKSNCGRPCDRHRVQLRDRIGMEHPLQADVGCRNTLFNATPQSAAEVVPTLLQRGVRAFRIEFLEEPADEMQTVIDLYRQLLAGQVGGSEVWQRLRASNRVGVTRGTLEERRNPLAIL